MNQSDLNYVSMLRLAEAYGHLLAARDWLSGTKDWAQPNGVSSHSLDLNAQAKRQLRVHLNRAILLMQYLFAPPAELRDGVVTSDTLSKGGHDSTQHT